MAIWAIKSFYYYAEVDWPLVIHDGGNLSAAIRSRLQTHFPDAWIVGAEEADRLVEAKLQLGRYSATIAGRRACNLMKKALDFALLAAAPRVLFLDSDVLFFARPRELVNRAKQEASGIVIMRDYQNSYSIDRAAALGNFGVPLPECINSGLGILPVRDVDLGFIEGVFSSGLLPLDKDGFAEQTLLALVASRAGFAYLPEEYCVVTGQANIGAARQIARHYVGPVKQLFFSEGVPHLVRTTRSLRSRKWGPRH